MLAGLAEAQAFLAREGSASCVAAAGPRARFESHVAFVDARAAGAVESRFLHFRPPYFSWLRQDLGQEIAERDERDGHEAEEQEDHYWREVARDLAEPEEHGDSTRLAPGAVGFSAGINEKSRRLPRARA